MRRASHRGYWYAGDPRKLSADLQAWLDQADARLPPPARALIVPHAGYEYSGSCSAHAYRQIDRRRVRRFFVLGPSHYTPHRGCCLPTAGAYETPEGGELRVDAAVLSALRETRHFDEIDVSADEEEHSIEMQLPYIAKVMDDIAEAPGGAARDYTIVPVIVGGINPKSECVYGEIFARYLRDPENVFIVSSDFCHWGKKFNYTLGSDAPRIDHFIANLDRKAMDVIESLNPCLFRDYLQETKNTICGRNAISILLNAITQAGYNPNNSTMTFLNYKQSSACRKPTDSCVCYAAASFVVHENATTNGHR